jgi:hypothetical protein
MPAVSTGRTPADTLSLQQCNGIPFFGQMKRRGKTGVTTYDNAYIYVEMALQSWIVEKLTASLTTGYRVIRINMTGRLDQWALTMGNRKWE